MKTGILGGTFDPVHTGHLMLAEAAYDEMGLDRIILIPTGCSYFKEGQNVTDPVVRYEMTCAAVIDNPHFEVSDIETRRPGNSYTYETLSELSDLYPDDEFYFIIGADTLVMMSMWKEPEKIFEKAVILVETRSDEVGDEALLEEAEKLRRDYNARIVMLPVRNIEISSTDIRNRVGEGKSIRYLAPEQVRTFIEEKGLYRRS